MQITDTAFVMDIMLSDNTTDINIKFSSNEKNGWTDDGD